MAGSLHRFCPIGVGMRNWRARKEDPRVMANRYVAEGLVRCIHSLDLGALAAKVRGSA